jgi:hypothetical protein
MEPIKAQGGRGNIAIELLMKIKENHGKLRAILKKNSELNDVVDSLNWEEGVIDSIIGIIK